MVVNGGKGVRDSLESMHTNPSVIHISASQYRRSGNRVADDNYKGRKEWLPVVQISGGDDVSTLAAVLPYGWFRWRHMYMEVMGTKPSGSHCSTESISSSFYSSSLSPSSLFSSVAQVGLHLLHSSDFSRFSLPSNWAESHELSH